MNVLELIWRDEAGPPETAEPVEEFRWETGPEGVILWVDGAPRGPLVGQSIAAIAGGGQYGVDGQAAAIVEAMEAAEETRFLPGVGLEGYDHAATLAWPFYGLAAGGMGATMGRLGLAGLDNAPPALVVDRLTR